MREVKTAKQRRAEALANWERLCARLGISLRKGSLYATYVRGKRPRPEQWTCKCGWENHGRACEECGRLKP